MSPLMLASEGQTAGHSPMVCLSSSGSDQAWLMDGWPVVGNVSTGLVRKSVFVIFPGWHLVLGHEEHGNKEPQFVAFENLSFLAC